ncbi:hypothetical protein BD770DRAFT_397285 [Pilaira anomala]|nr:hypothetical protein BD770DRAFT_397285 [Pilaira anomala]
MKDSFVADQNKSLSADYSTHVFDGQVNSWYWSSHPKTEVQYLPYTWLISSLGLTAPLDSLLWLANTSSQLTQAPTLTTMYVYCFSCLDSRV